MSDSTASGRRKKVSMSDVAARAGVSGQTVSRVANGLDNVEESTRVRVLAAMQELGYRPNKAARALRSGQFKNLGVTMFNLKSFGNIHTLEGISVAAAAAGYSITLVPVRQPTQANVIDAFRNLVEQAVDGIILLIEAHLVDAAEVALPPGLPVVIVDSPQRADYPVVDNDQAQGARLVTEHLLELGHETVWHISGPSDSYPAMRREAAWRASLEAAGRTVPPAYPGDWSTAAGYRWGLEIAGRPEITAVFAANDQMALGVLRALHERGRKVPEDISVVGFDDMPESDSFWPPLTTVRQDFDAVGRRTIEILLDEIEHGTSAAERFVVPVSLVVRSSTSPAPHPHTAS